MLHRPNMTLLAGVAAVALAGCRQEAPSAPEPLFVPATTAAAYEVAPPPALFAAEPIPPAPVADYSYAERAYALDRAFYEAPPDYGFSYMDAEPWAWRSTEGYEMYAEPIDDGYRYYYYEPGADYPFFVRAPDYGYGYDPGGLVTVVYSSAGAIVPYAYRDRRFDYAERYWKRARLMRAAAHRHHAPVVRDAWLSRRPALVASKRPWMKAAVERREWRGYRERDRDSDIRRLDQERERRIEIARRFDRDDDRPRPHAFDRPRAEPPRGAERPPRRERVERRAASQHAKLERRDEREVRSVRIERDDRKALRAEERRRERPERAARPERVARAEPPRREAARPERSVRESPRKGHRAAERPERQARLTRADRPERAARQGAPERAERREPRQAAHQEREPRQATRQERRQRPEQARRGGGGERQQAKAERRDRGGGQDRPERGRRD